MIRHRGEGVVRLPGAWVSGERDVLWFAYDEDLLGASIVSSVWELPEGWTASEELTDQSVTDKDGNQYTAANGVRLQFSGAPGLYRITNICTMTGPRVRRRSVDVLVGEA